MASSIEETGSFDGQYKDQLVRRLYTEEREERWSLFRSFREEMDDYRARMEGTTGRVWSVHHDLRPPSGKLYVATMDRNVRGSQVGPFDYVAIFRQDMEAGVSVRSLTTYSVARHHYALRWRTEEKREYIAKPPVGLSITSERIGPRSNRSTARFRSARDFQVRRLQEFALTPEINWHPDSSPEPLDDHITVKQTLHEAIGVVACLGRENAFHSTESLEGLMVGNPS
jgi:hypothetical protein